MAAILQQSSDELPKEESKLGENSLNRNLIEEKASPVITTPAAGDDEEGPGLGQDRTDPEDRTSRYSRLNTTAANTNEDTTNQEKYKRFNSARIKSIK